MKKPAKPKKVSVAQLKKKADVAFSIYIRQRDADRNGLVKCITCPKVMPWREAQNGHFVSRRVNSLRYDDENNNAQCPGCNVFKHGELYEYAIALDLKYGAGTAEKLHNRRFETHKLTVQELTEIIAEATENARAYGH